MKNILFLLAFWSLLAEGQSVAIKAGYLIDPDTGTVYENQIIIIDGTRVQEVGPNLTIPDNARTIDLSNSYVFPGLIDAHTHICNSVRERDAGRYFYTGINASTAERAVDGIINAQSMLNAGFTTIRDLGSEGNYACTAVRTAVNRREIIGPTIMNAGRIIAPFGAQYRLQPERPGLAEPDYIIADTRDEMLKAIRENIHYGARVLKVIVDDQSYIYSEGDLRFMREEVEKAGFKLAAHAGTEAGILNAAKAGVHSIEHVSNANEDSFRIMIENNVAAVFTNLPREYSRGPLESVERSYRRRNEKLSIGDINTISHPEFYRTT